MNLSKLPSPKGGEMVRSVARRMKLGLMLFAAVLILAPATAGYAPAAASEIKFVVNNLPVTSFDVQRRAAFLKLQRKTGNLQQMASDEMVEQALKTVEMKRLNIRIPDQRIDEAYARFAGNNKLKPAQLDQILAQSGITKEHFKQFIRTQMGWSQALQARYRAEGRMTEQQAVQRMLKQGGAKPSATEYMLQQVIFVVPASERGLLAKRKREAEGMRARFSGCESTRQFVKGLIDVTVRDLGRVLAPELPPDWADQIKATKPGAATGLRETDRGVEFIGICSTKEVSDDHTMRIIFGNEGTDEEKAGELSKKYLAELREKARIVQR
jgi:peptidyl-prolyl cis-trans isomerase SurA